MKKQIALAGGLLVLAESPAAACLSAVPPLHELDESEVGVDTQAPQPPTGASAVASKTTGN